MYTTLNKFQRNHLLRPKVDGRTHELANMLINAFGYENAVEQATQSQWHRVAETIHYLKSTSLRRF